MCFRIAPFGECCNLTFISLLHQEYDYDIYDNATWPTATGRSRAAPCEPEDSYGFAQRFSPVVYTLVFLLAFVGNVLVLCVIRRYRNSQSGGACAFSLTDTFLLHLAISDLLLAFTLPLFATQWAHQWVFGLAACKLSGALFSLNRYSGILFLACISFDRYLAIVHAVKTGANRTALLCVVWYTEHPTRWRVGLQLVGMLLGFGLPLLVMLYCYIRIFKSLCNATRRQKRKSLRLIVSLVSVFVVCWAPYNGFQLADSLHRLGAGLGLSHCALNPLLYGFVGVKFRRELGRMCGGLLGGRGARGMEGWKQRRLRKSTASFSSAESEHTSYSVMV
uniref:G-protein coupled receptors family 1 profile domain-containing protein n=1 Tax=Gasterosteus aculeatus aculeatus TaxID=481459 RepID=G3NAH4_GASAC